MRLATHLRVSPHGVFYFRVVVPTRLRPFFGGRSEIKKSLSTRNPKHARLCAYSLSARVGIQFQQAEDALRMGYDPKRFDPNDPSTFPDVEHASTFGITVKGYRIDIDPSNPQDIKEGIAAAKELAIDSGAHAIISRQMERQEAEELARLNAIKQAEEQAMLEAIEQAAAKRNADIQSDAPQPANQGNYKPTRFSAAMAEYQTEVLAHKSKGTQDTYNRTINWFAHTLGANDPFMHEISDELVRRWKEEELIPHFQKVADKKLADGIANGKFKIDPMVGVPKAEFLIRSVDNQITYLNTIFAVLQERKLYPLNFVLPTKGQTVVSHAKRKKLPGWEMFEEADLVRIFSADNLLALKKPHEFWMPLLALFTGARINELAQLTHNDIMFEDGMWVIKIRDKEYYQYTKNTASIRQAPLHPKLIELGFLDYLKDAREAVPEIDRIFPYLRYDKNNGFGDVPSEAFARYLDKLGIYDRKKVFHSLRKNANNRLKQHLQIPEAARCQLIGHVYESTNANTYGEPYSMATLQKDVVPYLDFPMIDFAPLKYPPGRFRDMLPREVAAALSRKRKNKQESKRLHEEARAALEARATPKKRGRPPKADGTGTPTA